MPSTQPEAKSLIFREKTGLPSWYPEMVNGERGPVWLYDRTQNLYYATYGPRNSPGKRSYPVRYEDGELKESQPEFYYTTTALADFAIIKEVIDDTHYRVDKKALQCFPSETPFYLYLIVRDSEGNLRITDPIPDTHKVKVIDIEEDILTITPGFILNVEGPKYFGFYERPVDEYIDYELPLFISDEQYEDYIIQNSVEIAETTGNIILYINLLAKDVDGWVEEEEDIEHPSKWPELLNPPYDIILVEKNDIDEVINITEHNVRRIVIQEDWEENGETWRKYKAYIDPPLEDLTPGLLFAFYTKQDQDAADIPDEELEIPLPATTWSLRPLKFHIIKPLSPAVYADIYSWNWGYPVPYAEKTFVTDCEEPTVQGYLTPEEFTARRLQYRRQDHQWLVGGGVCFPTCHSTINTSKIKECFANINHRWYLKFLANSGKTVMYHMHKKGRK